MKKAELLQDLAVYMRDRVDNFFDITITDAEARALVEALEGLRWVNVYKGPNRRREIANAEVRDINILNFDIIVQNKEYIETVGIIRLKDDEQ